MYEQQGQISKFRRGGGRNTFLSEVLSLSKNIFAVKLFLSHIAFLTVLVTRSYFTISLIS